MRRLPTFQGLINLARETSARRTRPARVHYEPTGVQIEITNHCNLLCSFCGRTNLSNLEMIGHMPLEKFQHVFNQFHHLRSVSLFGHGEPLMAPELFDILAWIRQKQGREFKINITTNGIILKQEFVDGLVEHNVRLTVSLDATNPETYKATVGAGTFHRVLQGLERLQVATEKHGYKWAINFLLTNENIGQVAEMVDYAKRYHARCLNIGEQNFYGAGARLDDAFIKFKDELRTQVGKALTRGEEVGQRVRFERRDRHVWPDHDTFVPCKYLWTFPFISWDGYVCLCCARPYPRLHNFGNVFEQPFQEIWFGEEYERFRREVAAGTQCTTCKGCQHLSRDAEETPPVDLNLERRKAIVRSKTELAQPEAEPKTVS